MAWLSEDGSTDLGVSVNLEVFALIDKSFALRVDHDAVGVRITRALIRSRFNISTVSIDDRGVTTAPVTEWQRAGIQGHADAVAGVIASAAHLDQIPVLRSEE